jgi:hypothetical protein
VSDQAARGPIFSATCARCGGSVSGSVSFCPHCGSPARFAFGGRAAAVSHVAPSAAVSGRAKASRQERRWPWRHRYRDMRSSPPGSTDGWGFRKGATLMSVAIVILVGGALLLRRTDDSDVREQRARSSTVQGVVKSNDTSPSNPPGRSTTSTADIAPAIVASSAIPASAASTVVSGPAQSSFSDSRNGEVPSPRSASGDKGPGDKAQRLMSLALSRAHDGLDRNDLHTARSGVYWALSMQPDNRDALLLKQDLVSRERARDAALKAIHSCSGQDRRQCVWQYASNALSIDSSSKEAQTLVKRSNGDTTQPMKPSGF